MKETLHGVEVDDPYRWLEDGDAPETTAWVAEQNERTRAALDALPGRAELHGRLVELLQAGQATSPRLRGDRLFSLDRWGDHEQAALVVRSASDPAVAARVVLDPAGLTDDRTAAIDWFHPSQDGRLVAYGVSEGGDERSVLRVVDVDTGDHLTDEIPDTRAASVGWLPDAGGFAYTRYPSGDEYGRHVRFHRLGDDPADDPVVFDEVPDRSAWPDVTISRDGRWLLVHVAMGWSRVDVHLIDRDSGERTTIIEGEDAITILDVVGDHVFGTTTLEAPRGRVVTAPLTQPQAPHWTTLVPEGDAVLEAAAVAGPSLLVQSTRSAVAALERYRLDGTGQETIDLPETGSFVGLTTDEDREEAFFSLTSFARPAALFRWRPGEMSPWSTLDSPVDPDGYLVEQVRYPSNDGTEIPMFLIRRADVDPSPDTPALLTAYGGFAVANTPVYSPTVAAWCDAGGIYALACIRGGAEEGEDWHRAGMREHKQQVFDDFHAAADWLVERALTSRQRLAIRGGSNGGLLMGVAVTQRPDLARAVHCAVPLLDMVRYHLFLIARLWIPEYGDPDVAEEFAWLHAYSPYHHVEPGTCYPAVLFTTAESDSRVDPLHARKMAALLQEATSCGDRHPILLRVETRAGHGQGKPVSKQADELADVLAFLFWQLGVQH